MTSGIDQRKYEGVFVFVKLVDLNHFEIWLS